MPVEDMNRWHWQLLLPSLEHTDLPTGCMASPCQQQRLCSQLGFGTLALWQAINMGHFSDTLSCKNPGVCSKLCSGSAQSLGGEAEPGLGQQCWGGGTHGLTICLRKTWGERAALPALGFGLGMPACILLPVCILLRGEWWLSSV